MNYSSKYPPSWTGAFLAALRPAPGGTLKAHRDALVVEHALANLGQSLRDAGMCAAMERRGQESAWCSMEVAARYRAALESIATLMEPYMGAYTGAENPIYQAWETARTALAADQPQGGG